jgi:hypothetical protein
MLRLLADENFNGEIVRGLLLRQPDMDLIRVQDVSLHGVADPEILAWAADNDCIVLTHDRATMPFYVHQRLAAGMVVPGVFVINDRFPVGRAIEELLLIADCTEQSEWNGVVAYLPL